MMARARFDDFLADAHRHLDLTPKAWACDAGDIDIDAVMGSLSRLVYVMRRYAEDLTATIPKVSKRAKPLTFDPWTDASLRTRQALDRATPFLMPIRGQWRPTGTAPSDTRARRLEAAAASLRVGRDLLHTHVARDHDGTQRQRSEWAVVIASDTVTRALLTEIASLACKAADHCLELGIYGSAEERRRLNAASQLLRVPDAAVATAFRRMPTGESGRELLGAVPVNVTLARVVPRGGEPVGELCEGVAHSAERARHLAWLSARDAEPSQDITITSLRRVGESSTVASHNCVVLVNTLAKRMAKDGNRDARGPLAEAASAVRRARDAWFATAMELRRITTATRDQVPALATGPEDLALWTGRLAYSDPQWSLARGPNQPVRSAEEFTQHDVALLAAAVHQACDALTGISHAEVGKVQVAVRAGRILVPTRSLPERYDIPHPFVRMPQERAEQLLTMYAEAGEAGRRATDAIGEVAEIVHAPSRTLTLARNAAAGRQDPGRDALPGSVSGIDRTPGARAAPGMVERTLLDLGITDPGTLARGAGIDRDADRLFVEAATQTAARASQPSVMPRPDRSALTRRARQPRQPWPRLGHRQATPPERESPEPEP